VTEPVIPLAALAFCFAERIGNSSMKRSNKFGFHSIFRKAWRASFRSRREEGSTLYEFAMVLPLLSMFLVGVIYGGITFYDYVTLAEAVAVGVRSLATNAGNSTPCTTATTALTNAATSLKTSEVTISISFPSTNTHTDSCTGTISEGDYAMVNATYPCNMTVPFTGINLCPVSKGSTTNSSGATTMSCPYTSCVSSTTIVRIE
jgi:Flp pilus assembly protein TadG